MANMLIVDDSPIIRRNLRRIMEEMGHFVVAEAGDGAEGVEKYKEWKPDMVTMDIQMAGLNGIEAVRQIRGFDPAAVIVMITSVEQRNLVYEALKLGAKHYIVKPFTDEKVQEVLQAMFGLTPLQEAAQQRKIAAVASAQADKKERDAKKGESLKLDAPALVAMPFEISVKDGRVNLVLQRHVNANNIGHFHACLQGLLYMRSAKYVVELWEPLNDKDAARLMLEFITAIRNRKGTVGVVAGDVTEYNVWKSKLVTGVYARAIEIDW